MSQDPTTSGGGDFFERAADRIWTVQTNYGDVHAREIALLREKYPGWCDQFEECVLDTAEMGQLEDLVHSAPTDYSCGVIYGVILMRVQTAAMTGRQLQWNPEESADVFDSTSSELKTPNYGARQAAEMLKLRQRHSDWYAYFEDCIIEIASREEIEELLQSAPTAFATGTAYGVIVMRVYMGMLTGREFS